MNYSGIYVYESGSFVTTTLYKVAFIVRVMMIHWCVWWLWGLNFKTARMPSTLEKQMQNQLWNGMLYFLLLVQGWSWWSFLNKHQQTSLSTKKLLRDYLNCSKFWECKFLSSLLHMMFDITLKKNKKQPPYDEDIAMKNYDTICIIFESINDVLPPPR